MRVIGHRFSKESHDLRDFLARNRVPARWLDVERDGEARELLAVVASTQGACRSHCSSTARCSSARRCSSSPSASAWRARRRRSTTTSTPWASRGRSPSPRAARGGAIVEITDDGPGIPEEIRERIFGSFFTTKDAGKGSGLGLETARRIVVDRHDGSLTVDSEPGRTTFPVRLPFGQA